MQCQIKKTNIISLLILFLDKILIIKTINIFKKYLKKLKIENIAIINKLLIFKENFIIIYNIIRAIY